jgi:hypothetical protein
MRLFVSIALLCALSISCGKNDSAARKARSVQNDSLMALFNAPSGTDSAQKARILPDTTAQTTTAPLPNAEKKDTAATLDAALKTGASIIAVDSGSKEDRRLDSLMTIANTLSARYRALVSTHTHQNLAQAAHQDPAKQRRLLKTITERAPERFERARIIAEERKKRLREMNGEAK